MSSTEAPEPWRTRMIERGFVDPRYDDPRASLSRLASAMGMHTSTVANAIFNRRHPNVETVQGLVAQLGDDVAAWLDRPVVREWTPPAEAALLTDRQRKAVEEIIRVMTERQDDCDGPSKTHAAVSAAEDQKPTRRAKTPRKLKTTVPARKSPRPPG